MHVCVHNCFNWVWFFVTLWAVVCQASLSMGFSRQEYGGRSPCPPPGDLPGLGIELTSLTHVHYPPPTPSLYPQKGPVWGALPWHIAFLSLLPGSSSFCISDFSHLCLSLSLHFFSSSSSLPFFYDLKDCLVLWSALSIQTPHKPGCVIGPLFLQRNSLFKSPARLCPRFQGPGWWMEAIMASALPLGPRQPQVQAASAGLVNYDTGQPWGEAHVAGWAAEPPRPSTLQMVFTLGLLWGTPCPHWGTHELQAPLVGLGVWALEPGGLASAPGPVIC